MKILRITESQYKRLVRGKNLLNEQFKKIVYLNDKDKYDVNPDMVTILDYINYKFDSLYNKSLYVLKIEDGKVYVDTSKYTDEEIEYVKNQADLLMKSTKYSKDKLIDDEDFAFDSGVDSDYDWGDEDITVVEPDDDTAEIDDNDDTTEEIDDNDDTTEEIDDNDDVAEVEDEIEDISYCDYGMNSKGQKRKFVPPPNMDIKFYQDILKSIGANVTCQKMLFFYAWRTGESSKSAYNPFATTQPNEVNEGCYYNCLKSGRGYTPVGCRECPSGTSPGVRNYKTYESGLKNTVKTLTNGRYNNVVTKLKNDNITAEEIASEKSELKTWGTGGLVLDILKYNKKIKPTPISKYGDEPQYVLPDDENIIDCESCLTKIQTKTYDENVNDENVKDFRWWINQDSNILKSVTDKLKECCETKSDPTISTSYNIKNDHTLIAFSVVGNEWINSGKPGKPKESNLTFTPPNRKGWIERGVDGQGSGEFDASRGNRKHKGVDIISNAGDVIVSPIDGYVSKVGYRIYSTKCSYLVGVDITGTGDYEGYKIRLFYVKSDVTEGVDVDKGDPIGKQQSLNNNCYPQKYSNGNYTMKNHVHVEVYYNGILKNPSNYNWSNKQSSNTQTNNDEVIDNTNTIEENSNLPRKFDKVPIGTNVYRSNQPSLSQLKYILNNYDIDTVVRMNGEEGTGVTPEDEKELVESMGKNYVFQNAHINEGGGSGHRGYETGKGYVGSLNAVQPILKQGNVLIHCSAGADRTGYQVARFMKDNGYCGNPDSVDCRKTLWNYTTKYNNWKRYIPEGRVGYIRYMEAFYPHDKWKKEIGK